MGKIIPQIAALALLPSLFGGTDTFAQTIQLSSTAPEDVDADSRAAMSDTVMTRVSLKRSPVTRVLEMGRTAVEDERRL